MSRPTKSSTPSRAADAKTRPAAEATSATKPTGHRRVGGPLDMFDIELIGFVCPRSEELGRGQELYTTHVATLDRAGRAKLWNALGPVVARTHCDIDASDLGERGIELRRVTAELGLDSELADAFLLDDDAFYDAHLQGGSRAYHEIRALDAVRKLKAISPDLLDAMIAVASGGG